MKEAEGASLLGAFVEALVSAPDVAARWAIFSRELAALGADQINYGIIDTFVSERVEAPVRFLSTMDPQWIEYYGDRRLDLEDPHVTFVRNGNLKPYLWGESVLPELESEGPRDAVALTVEAGLRAQLSITVPDPLGAGLPVGGLTIGSSLSEKEFFASIDGKEAALIGAGLLFHNHAIGEVRRAHAGAKPLSSRERDCLTHAALGRRVDAIADRLCITVATVELHLRNGRKKLNAATTGQAVARALMFGDIRL